MKRQITPKQAIVRLEELCSRSEQCTDDLRRKLTRWAIPSDAAEKIIDHLIDNRFVDDQRFAMAYTREKYLFSKWGRRKIATALYAKRIDREIINAALSSIDNREYAKLAYRVIAAKLKSLPEELEHYEKRQRLLRFGISRGYETALIVKIIDSRSLWEC